VASALPVLSHELHRGFTSAMMRKIAQPNLAEHRPAPRPLPFGDGSGVLNQVSAPEQFG